MLQLSCNWFPAGALSLNSRLSLCPSYSSHLFHCCFPFFLLPEPPPLPVFPFFFTPLSLNLLPVPTLPFPLLPLICLPPPPSSLDVDWVKVGNGYFFCFPTESWSLGACECSLKCCLHFLIGNVCAAAHERRNPSSLFFIYQPRL